MAEDEKVGDIFTPNKHNISTVIRKISELEKKVDDIEKWRKEFRKVEEISQCYKERFDVLQNEISELREGLRTHGNHPLTDSMWKQHEECFWSWQQSFQEQISELKERVEGIHKSIHGISDDEKSKPPKRAVKYYECKCGNEWCMKELQSFKFMNENNHWAYKCPNCNETWFYIYDSNERFIEKESPEDLTGSAWQTELQEPFDLRRFIEFALENAKIELPNKEQISEYILVEKADLERIFSWINPVEFIEPHRKIYDDMREKYLSEEAEK